MSDDSIEITAHGAGENFPLDDSGEQLDSAPADNKRDPIDRRVELFFFDPEFGISPAPSGQISKAGSTDYPTWRQRVSQVIELQADELDGPKVTFIEMADAHFRTNSAVVLPEGENPDQTGSHQAFTSVGVIATALRFNEEHPGRTLLVAGHTDTAADENFNQKLSDERAQVTLAMLKGGDDSREAFKSLCDGRHTVSDVKQILSWLSGAFASLTFNCDPGKIDDNAGNLAGPVKAFQSDYNTNKANAANNNPSLDPTQSDLTVDGSVGPLTWGAFFDCFELALQQELGETAASLATLRGKLTFTDPNHESLGFSEYFPVEELGVDNFRSQANRRSEILFFESGEEPDIQHAADDPETSDLYLPGHFERTPLPPMPTAKRPNQFDVHVRAFGGIVSTLRLSTDWGFEQRRTTDDAALDPATPGLLPIHFDKLPDLGLFSLSYRNEGGPELSVLSDLPFAALGGLVATPVTSSPPGPISTTSSEAANFDPNSYLDDYTVI
jgi:hypothetical protein